MLLQLLNEQHVRLETAVGDDGLSIDGEGFGPLPMLAASLVLCTASVLFSYAETAQLDLRGLAIEARWEYAEDPHRVSSYDLTLHLPANIPQARHRALLRVADSCTVHGTLSHPPSITTNIETFEPHAHAHHEHHHHAHEEQHDQQA
jgi:putative redox protein